MRDEQPSAARFSTHLVDQRSKPRLRPQPIEKRFDREHSYLPIARLICLLDQIHRSVVLTEAEMHDRHVEMFWSRESRCNLSSTWRALP
jgi:hypothetical protein